MHLRHVMSLLALTLLSLAALAGAARPDFSGTYTLDLKRSRLEAEGARRIGGGTVTIEHREPRFAFRRAFVVDGKEHRIAYSMLTDGKPVERSEEGRTLRSTMTWDGAVLVYATTITAPDGKATNVVRYHLDDGGRTFVAEESFSGPKLKYSNVWIFSRSPGASPRTQ